LITIDLIPAGYGDTILISFEPKLCKGESYVLIDCGFNYTTEILPILQRLGEKPKKLDRFIITHYDDDHISSAEKFIIDNGTQTAPKVIGIDQVWLNTYRHLQLNKPEVQTQKSAASQELKNFMLVQNQAFQTGETEIGARQAFLTGSELLRYGYPWNTDFNEEAVCVENRQNVRLKKNVHVTLLSPGMTALKKLEAKFVKALKDYGIEPKPTDYLDDAFEAFMKKLSKEEEERAKESESSGARRITPALIRRMVATPNYEPDTAPGNGSSIAFILALGRKKLLMLADAHSEVIIAELKKLYPDPTTYPIYFDLVKVAHHGSFKNNNPALFQMIDSKKFLFSTNGEHQSHEHPDMETIAHIVHRPLPPGIKRRTLIFNYELRHLSGLKSAALQQEFGYRVQVKTKITL